MRKSLLFAATVLCFACSPTSFSHAADPLVAAFLDGVSKGKQKVQGGQGDLGGQSGQNDPAQQFQQILDQLTQGQQRASGDTGPRRKISPKLKLAVQYQTSETPR